MKFNSVAKAFFFLLAATLEGGSVLALSTDKDRPIQVEADSMVIDDGKGVTVYQGNVELRQGTIHLTAERVTIRQKEGKSKQVEAEGVPVVFRQRSDTAGELIEGRSRRAEYSVESELLYLIGDAELSQGGDRFQSDRIVYDRARAVVKAGRVAKGKGRVSVTIDPNKREGSAE